MGKTKLDTVARKQLLAQFNEARQLANISQPKQGWIRTLRKTLGMTGDQLGRRLGVGKSRISQLEDAEQDGSITLNSLQDAAAAIGCRVVYAVVPEESIEVLIEKQAEKRAQALVKTASMHMAMEQQALDKQKQGERIRELKHTLMETRSRELWDD